MITRIRRRERGNQRAKTVLSSPFVLHLIRCSSAQIVAMPRIIRASNRLIPVADSPLVRQAPSSSSEEAVSSSVSDFRMVRQSSLRRAVSTSVSASAIDDANDPFAFPGTVSHSSIHHSSLSSASSVIPPSLSSQRCLRVRSTLRSISYFSKATFRAPRRFRYHPLTYRFSHLVAHNDEWFLQSGEHWFTIQWADGSREEQDVKCLFPKEGMNHEAVKTYERWFAIPQRDEDESDDEEEEYHEVRRI